MIRTAFSLSTLIAALVVLAPVAIAQTTTTTNTTITTPGTTHTSTTTTTPATKTTITTPAGKTTITTPAAKTTITSPATKTTVTAPAVKTTTTTAVKSTSTLETNRKIARQWYEELIVKENLPMIDVLVANDAVMEMSPSTPSKATGTSRVTGKENIRKHLKHITDNFAFKGSLLDVIAEGDKVVLYRVVEETDKAGHKALVPWISIIQISNNKIKKVTHVHDTLHESNQFKAAK